MKKIIFFIISLIAVINCQNCSSGQTWCSGQQSCQNTCTLEGQSFDSNCQCVCPINQYVISNQCVDPISSYLAPNCVQMFINGEQVFAQDGWDCDSSEFRYLEVGPGNFQTHNERSVFQISGPIEKYQINNLGINSSEQFTLGTTNCNLNSGDTILGFSKGNNQNLPINIFLSGGANPSTPSFCLQQYGTNNYLYQSSQKVNNHYIVGIGNSGECDQVTFQVVSCTEYPTYLRKST